MYLYIHDPGAQKKRCYDNRAEGLIGGGTGCEPPRNFLAISNYAIRLRIT